MKFVTQRGTEDSDHTNWPIEQVLDHYGWDGVARGTRRWVRVRCPWHLDRTPSAALSYELNAFRCFSCDRAGNSVTLTMAEEGLDAREAVEWLSERFGADDGVPAPRAPRESRGPRIPWEPMTLR